MFPTLLAAAGDATAKEDLLKGKKVGDTTFKVHIDGYNLIPAFKGGGEWPRREFLYWTDDGHLAALRYNQWKNHLPEARCPQLGCLEGTIRRIARSSNRQSPERSLRT